MPKRWTEEEIKILKRHYRKKGAQYVAKFVEHSADTVMNKAAELGIRYNGIRPWSEWEDRYLRSHINDWKNASIARTLKRTIRSVTGRVERLNLTGEKEPEWTGKEIEYLQKLYPDHNYSLKLISEIINRSENAVLLKAIKMGLSRSNKHKWNKREHNYLLKNAGKKTYKQIAEHLGMESYQVAHYAGKIGIKVRDRGTKWTEEEKKFIKRNYGKMSIQEIATKLNRSVNAVKNTASRMGAASSGKRPWRKKEEEYLKKHYAKISINEISENLKRSKKAIVTKAFKLGLSKKRVKRSK
ncbi:sigma-70, region 4 [bacterium BMS3Abin03]|nr:sigma-70, region 4 [bacterium BMS3Abin03]